MTKAISTLGEAFKKKTTAFLTLGILLMTVSMYINVLEAGAGDIGVNHSIIIIWFAIFFQVISWIKFFKLFPARPEHVVTDNQPGSIHVITDNGNKWEKILTVIFLYLTAYTIMKDALINKLSALESWMVPLSAAFFTVVILISIDHFYIKK